MEYVWTSIVNGYYSNVLGWDITLGVLVILAMIKWPQITSVEEGGWWNFHPRGRGKMLRRARRNYVRSMIIDELVSIIELRVFNGEITRNEAKELYRDARKYWPVKDLFPAPELLKENIKKRRASGTHSPVSLPDPLPKAKHAFEKAAAKLPKKMPWAKA